ncbi:MAG: phosphotransferase, partial [Gemmatimonadaceae bacterium]
IDAVATWLAAHQPSERGATLIHNDFKFDNLVLDVSDPSRILAVLDWEMVTVGDPLMDLGTTLAYWVEPRDAPAIRALGLGVTSAPGMLTRVQVVEQYATTTGRSVDDVVFYFVYGLFKVAVIAQQIHARWVRGFTADPRFAQLDQAVAALGAAATHAISTGRLTSV